MPLSNDYPMLHTELTKIQGRPTFASIQSQFESNNISHMEIQIVPDFNVFKKPSEVPVQITKNEAPAPSLLEQQDKEAQPPAQATMQKQPAQPLAPQPPVQEKASHDQEGAFSAQQHIAPLPRPSLRNQTLNPQQIQAQRLKRISQFAEIEVIDIVATETDGTQESTRAETRKEKKMKKKEKERKERKIAERLLKSGIKTVAKPGIFVAKTAQRGMESGIKTVAKPGIFVAKTAQRGMVKGVNKITGIKKSKDKENEKKQQITGDYTQEVVDGAEVKNATMVVNINSKKLKKEKSRSTRTSTGSIGFPTAEYEVLKAKNESVMNLNRRYESRVAQLNLEIMSLEETIDGKDQEILMLRQRLKEIASTRNSVDKSTRRSIAEKRGKKRQLEKRRSQMKEERISMHW